MIERRAFVVSAQTGYVWVSAQAESACNSCQLSNGCGAGALNRWMAGRQRLLRVRTEHPVALGAEVTVGIDESALVQGSLLLYLLPLLLMLAAAIIGRELAPAGWLDPAAVAGAVLGLSGGLWLVRGGWISRIFRHWQPVLLDVGTNKPEVSGKSYLLP